MISSTDKEWLEKCQPEALPVPPFDRYVYMLEGYVVKKSLKPGELGFHGYQPDTSTISQRDENELRTLEVVRQSRIFQYQISYTKGTGSMCLSESQV
ncbi:uncharacterized protein N7498_009268 [Penicillium cinerascens]|uniref:Uncharacterized protein n=1 Tax=Penicillium cinerascens TaxID=70096 RepID=A0A9W9M662_9EURO|nr:uncharacterized protein N7498_009268 [Penicillium cinerascens]KAJ5190283.1 hypothetical protein N7498_009268 [Penicillium cinerascens]